MPYYYAYYMYVLSICLSLFVRLIVMVVTCKSACFCFYGQYCNAHTLQTIALGPFITLIIHHPHMVHIYTTHYLQVPINIHLIVYTIGTSYNNYICSAHYIFTVVISNIQPYKRYGLCI